MLSLSLVTLGLAAVGAYAKPVVRATASLEISLSTPADKVASTSELRVVAIVKNFGDEDLKVIKSGTVLDDEHPTRSFIITKDGNQVPFTGVETSVPTDDPSENDWVVIPVGGNVTTEHDVFAAYDFSAVGAGTFTFDPVTRFQIVGLDAVEAKTAHSVSITVTDEVSKRELNLEKRVAFQCNDQDNNSRLISFYNKAKFMANTASLYIQQKGTGDQLYKDYFGSNPDGRVIKNFETVWTDNSPSRTLLCPDTCQSDGPAYVSGDSIFFCKIFFGLSDPPFCPSDVPDPQGAPTTIALITLTHAILQTGSDAVGCHDARNLRNDRKMGNTDNYVCFASAVFHANGCKFS